MKTEHVGNLQGLHKLFHGNIIRLLKNLKIQTNYKLKNTNIET